MGVTMSGNVSAWLRRYDSSERASVSLVCFPHAGGSASFFLPMSRALAPAVDILAIQYPGRQDRYQEPPLDSIADLADQIYSQLRKADLGRLALFGHSMGATIAFEVARRLESDQQSTVLRLFASGRRAPSIATSSQVHLLDAERLMAEIRRLSGTELELIDDDELLRASIPVLRSDYKAIETYPGAPGVQVACPITALVGSYDPLTSVEQASAWKYHTRDHFDLCVFPGGHFYLAPQGEHLFREVSTRIGAPSPT